jgi:hypothetical protein
MCLIGADRDYFAHYLNSTRQKHDGEMKRDCDWEMYLMIPVISSTRDRAGV